MVPNVVAILNFDFMSTCMHLIHLYAVDIIQKH